MNRDSNKHTLQRLSEGIKDREMLDDVMYKQKEMFQNLSFDFNNTVIHIDIPPGSEDIDRIEEMDPNDESRIQILRDGLNTNLWYLVSILHHLTQNYSSFLINHRCVDEICLYDYPARV